MHPQYMRIVQSAHGKTHSGSSIAVYSSNAVHSSIAHSALAVVRVSRPVALRLGRRVAMERQRRCAASRSGARSIVQVVMQHLCYVFRPARRRGATYRRVHEGTMLPRTFPRRGRPLQAHEGLRLRRGHRDRRAVDGLHMSQTSRPHRRSVVAGLTSAALQPEAHRPLVSTRRAIRSIASWPRSRSASGSPPTGAATARGSAAVGMVASSRTAPCARGGVSAS